MTIHAMPASAVRPSRRPEPANTNAILRSAFIYTAFGLSVVFSFAVVFGVLN
jgi:hypothetical protein